MIFDSIKKFFGKLNPFSKKDGKKVVEELLKHPIDLNKSIRLGDMKDGSICYFEYDPKDKTQIWDYKPLMLVLGISRTYILGLNFHWIDMKYRLDLIEQIIKINTKKGTIKMPLEFTYKDIKPFLDKNPYRKCIHLYIRGRMSNKGVLIDPKYLLDIARLKLEHFE